MASDRERRRAPHRLALTLALAGLVVIALGFYTRFGELAIVLGLFLLFLAGGVLNWDRRSGH
jgi:hypothetical protein